MRFLFKKQGFHKNPSSYNVVKGILYDILTIRIHPHKTLSPIFLLRLAER